MTRTETTGRSVDAPASLARPRSLTGAGLEVYLAIGMCFGIVATKGEVVSWFRIQEMFRFQAFHMYGVMATALAVAMVAIALIKSLRVRTVRGDIITISPKDLGQRGYRYWIGGTFFGLGWGLTGACPGPIFALIGNGMDVYGVVLVSALVGTWFYGVLRPSLPH